MRLRGFWLALLVLRLAHPAAGRAADLDPAALATALAELGPRPPGSAASAAARTLLRAALAQAGLESIAVEGVPGEAELWNLTGVLPGAGGGAEILLVAHYDTVPGSPGAVDDASGCAVAVAAAADLARTPRRHPVRVALFDGEETGLRGSRGWLRARQPAAEILAVLDLDMVGAGGGRAAAVAFPVHRAGGRRGRRVFPPGWLVHAALRGGEAALWPLAFGDERWSLPAQLLLRAARPAYGADGDAFLEAGVPALLLTDFSLLRADPAHHGAPDVAARLDPARLAGWSAAAAAIVRRLDALAGRPPAEDEYLVLAGRVWLRRDLVWAGLALWIALVVAGRPGRWRGAPAEERRHRGRWYVPGFLFRALFLVAVLTAPALALPLLAPAGLLGLFPPPEPWRRRLWIGLGLLPTACLLLFTAWAARRGAVASWDLGWTTTILFAATLAAYAATCSQGARPVASP